MYPCGYMFRVYVGAKFYRPLLKQRPRTQPSRKKQSLKRAQRVGSDSFSPGTVRKAPPCDLGELKRAQYLPGISAHGRSSKVNLRDFGERRNVFNIARYYIFNCRKKVSISDFNLNTAFNYLNSNYRERYKITFFSGSKKTLRKVNQKI